MTGETNDPELSPGVAERRTGLRTGWTTGTCASAAAKAAHGGGAFGCEVVLVDFEGDEVTARV